MNGLKTMVCGKTCIGLAAGAAAAFCWGFHAVLVRRLVTDIPGIAIAVIRLYVAVAAIFLLLKLRRAPIRFAARGNWPYLLVAGLFGVALNFFFFHKGLEYTTAANAMLIEGSPPVGADLSAMAREAIFISVSPRKRCLPGVAPRPGETP